MGGMSVDVRVAPVRHGGVWSTLEGVMGRQQVRAALVDALAQAGAERDEAVRQLGLPFSDAQRWLEVRARAEGRQAGLSRAIELFDAEMAAA